MNKIMFGLVAALTLQSTSALAIHRPGWERPVLEAQMTEFDSLGHEIGIGLEKVLTMNRRDGAASATSFTLDRKSVV